MDVFISITLHVWSEGKIVVSLDSAWLFLREITALKTRYHYEHQMNKRTVLSSPTKVRHSFESPTKVFAVC